MTGLWRYREGGGKYLVQRRDGTVPEWPYFVLGARDPAAASTLRRYARLCEFDNRDPEYVEDVRRLADEFDAYLTEHGAGDPDGEPHRSDDPGVASKIAKSLGACIAALVLASLLAGCITSNRQLSRLASAALVSNERAYCQQARDRGWCSPQCYRRVPAHCEGADVVLISCNDIGMCTWWSEGKRALVFGYSAVGASAEPAP